MSDDDKIRLQLFVDVKHYLKTMESLGVKPTEVADVEKLEESARKKSKVDQNEINTRGFTVPFKSY